MDFGSIAAVAAASATGPDDVGTSAAASSVPTDGVREAGEFGGGNVVNVAIADAAALRWLEKGSTRARLFSLRVLSKDDRDELCMGEIGSIGKFCVDPECTTEAHKEQEFEIDPPSISVSDTYVFVAFSETILLKSWCLPVELFDNLELYTTQTRVWEDWEVLFRELGKRASLSDDDIGAEEVEKVSKVLKRLGQHISLMPEGPAKRLKMQFIREKVEKKYTRDLLITVDPEDEVLPTHLNTIVKEVNALRQDALENEIMQEAADIPNIHMHLSAIGNVMGARDESSDPRPIMDHLRLLGTTTNELVASTSGIDASVKLLSNVALTGVEHKGVADLFKKYGAKDHKPDSTFQNFANDIFVGLQTYLIPLTTWVSRWTTPKGKEVMQGLDAKILDFEAKLLKLSTEVAVVAGAGGGSSTPLQSAFGGLGLNATLTPGVNNPAPTVGIQATFESRFKAVEDEVAALKFGTKSVSVNGQMFSSKADVAAWLKLNGSNPQGYLFCVDVPSFLAMAFTGCKDMQSKVQLEVMANKSKYRTPEHMLVTNSFGTKIPEVFTKGKSLTDPMMLAAMPTFLEFDGTIPSTGFRFTFETLAKEYRLQAEVFASGSLGYMGASVAHGCIAEAVAFLIRLLEWMAATYADLQKVSPGAGGDNWKYVCHCVRVVFEVIHDSRRIGGGRANDSAGTMWGCLQGIRGAREILAKGISAHPTVANVLNIHMQKRSMMREEHETIQAATGKAMSSLREDVTRLSSELARLKSKKP